MMPGEILGTAGWSSRADALEARPLVRRSRRTTLAKDAGKGPAGADRGVLARQRAVAGGGFHLAGGDDARVGRLGSGALRPGVAAALPTHRESDVRGGA